MLKILVALIALLVTSCSLVAPSSQEVASGTEGIQSLNSGKKELNAEAIQNCTNLKRPLNPASAATSSESKLSRSFRLAYAHETEGNFDKAILNYRKATELSNCDCDRLHAKAGEKAAREAKALFKKEGMAAKPTQFFWGRLQELTQPLPCVEIE